MKLCWVATRFGICLTILMALSLVACGGAANKTAPGILTISGDGGATRVLEILANAYGEQHSEPKFNFLASTGSGGGAQGAMDGSLDLGVMARPPKDSESARGIQFLPFARDRVAVVTSPDLSITGLTSQQLNDIFAGVISNWSEVGGPDATINVLVREETASTTEVLRKGLKIGRAKLAPWLVVQASDGETKTALSIGSNSIGYINYSGVRLDNPSLNVLVIDGQDPADVGSAYRMDMELGVAYLPDNAGKVQPFLDFITSPRAKELLAEKGLVPVK